MTINITTSAMLSKLSLSMILIFESVSTSTSETTGPPMDWQYRLHLCCSLPTPACLPISALVTD